VTEQGKRRLRRVAKVCQNYGQRVQNSVFECWVDAAQWVSFRATLLSEIEPGSDSLRFYFLGDRWRGRVEHVGAKPSYDPEGPLII
jgi:CRISPR-associated protein Cas2